MYNFNAVQLWIMCKNYVFWPRCSPSVVFWPRYSPYFSQNNAHSVYRWCFSLFTYYYL